MVLPAYSQEETGTVVAVGERGDSADSGQFVMQRSHTGQQIEIWETIFCARVAPKIRVVRGTGDKSRALFMGMVKSMTSHRAPL